MKKVSSPVVMAFSEEDAAKLTGVSQSQLRRWDMSGFFRPAFADDDRRLSHSRIYSFRDLASIQVLNELRNRAGVSMQHLRKVKDELAHLGDDLWAKTTLYVLNKRVVFQNPENANREEVVSKQGVLNVPLLVVRRDLQKRVQLHWERAESEVGQVSTKRNVAHNRPVLSGTRIPVAAIRQFHDAGYSAEQIREEYPGLSRADVEAAIRFGSAA